MALRGNWYWTHQTSNRFIRSLFDCKKAFQNTYVDEKVAICNRTILNILHNFVPHKTLLVDDKDPPRLSNKIKTIINKKNTIFKHFRQNSNNLQIWNKLESPLTKSIAESKRNFHYRMADKLHNTQKSSKPYWSLLKRFLDNKNIPLILHFSHDNEFVTSFRKKVEFFNSLFDKHSLLWSIIIEIIYKFYLDNVIFSIE